MGSIRSHKELNVYRLSFVAKLTDSEAECAETLVWLEYAHACEYISKEEDTNGCNDARRENS